MSGKSSDCLGSSMVKWRPCKILAKLNKSHLLMANILELHEYQTFFLMQKHKMIKI